MRMENSGQNRLEGRRILITGAASGLGKATATSFAAQGARLALLDRDETGLSDVVAMHDAAAFPCDVSEESEVVRAVASADAAMEGLDGVVNAAGIFPRGSIEDMPTETWRKVIDINLLGTMFVCRAAIPALRRAGKATIVNIASIGGLRPAPNVAAYDVSKAGVVMLSKCLAVELGRSIRVNTVCPGIIATPMTQDLLSDKPTMDRLVHGNALGRLGEPEDIASALLYLTSHESSFTNGATLVVDGGYTWL